ncbi:MFS general substrate transporter [Backusella circina FSU 941]|nr:MFS general substrate transporter [Backusella circina FSU 941]
MLSIFIISLDSTVIVTSLPNIASDLGAANEIGWIGSSYLLTMTFCQPLYGRLSDIFGRREIFTIVNIIFLIGSILCGISQNVTMLIVCRAMQGVGGGGIIALLMILVADITPIDKRVIYQSLIALMYGISVVVGPLLGGLITEYTSWSIIIILIAVLCMRIPKPHGNLKEKLSKIDYIGSLLLILATVSLMLGVQFGGEKSYNSVTVISLLATGSALFLCFIIVESFFIRYPLFPKSIIRDMTCIAIFCDYFCLGLAYDSSIFFAPIYFQVALGETAIQSGLELLPLCLGYVIAIIMTGAIIALWKKYRLLLWIGFSMSIIGSALIYTLSLESTKAHQVIYTLLSGMGLGMALQTCLIGIQSSVHRRDLAIASATGQFFQALGGSFGIGISSSIFNSKVQNGLENVIETLMFDGVPKSFEFINDLPLPIQALVKRVFVHAINQVFFAGNIF